jgi:glycine cleavage system T protein
MMKRSMLFEHQTKLGARFGEYHGWQLPEYYSNPAEEYSAARNSAVIIERPYFGYLKISGKDHVDLLHRLTTNELRDLQPGEGQINIFTNEKGRIVDRVILHKFADEIRLTTSPQNSDKIAKWIDKFTFIEEVKVENLTEKFNTLSLFGPKSAQRLQDSFVNKIEDIPNQHFRQILWQNQSVIISRNDELGLMGFDLILPRESVPKLWEDLLKQDAKPMGEAVYESLRIEAGWPLYGADFDEEINPHEAGMLPYINFNKGCYIGQEVIARLDTYDKVQKHLMGIIFEGGVRPNSKDTIMSDEQEIGYVTSVGFSFALKKNIAFGYVRTRHAEKGAEVVINSQEKLLKGKLVKLPFKV